MKATLLCIFTICTALSFGQTIDINLMSSGFEDPTEITNAGDTRLFVTEKGGKIKILSQDGIVDDIPFLDIGNIISSGGERGLLGLAFHPDYDTNGFFYVNYTNTSGNTVIARYSVDENDADIADPNSGSILMTIDQPFSNHNGGCIRFGPDGYLYISVGDGGSGGDPDGNGQNINTLLGSLLRIDVDGEAPYSIPADNPFLATEGADEIWAYGLRNAWKFSFDKETDDIWIADVGQNAVEEINMAESEEAGLNYGWRCFEGSTEFNMADCDENDPYVFPIAEYTHSDTGGCSITGGYVYRGDTYPELEGKYIFADYCNHQIGYLDSNENIVFSNAFPGEFFTTFGEDVNGELYIAGSGTTSVYRIVDASASTAKNSVASFSIYPNPADDVVTIQSGNSLQAATANIYDISGKLLLSKQFASGAGTNTINTNALPAGLYIVDVTDTNGAQYSYKLSVR